MPSPTPPLVPLPLDEGNLGSGKLALFLVVGLLLFVGLLAIVGVYLVRTGRINRSRKINWRERVFGLPRTNR